MATRFDEATEQLKQAERDSREIENQCRHLESMFNDLDRAVDIMQDRLQAVLSPADTSAVPDLAEPRAPMSELATWIAKTADEIDRVGRKLSRITQRLEL